MPQQEQDSNYAYPAVMAFGITVIASLLWTNFCGIFKKCTSESKAQQNSVDPDESQAVDSKADVLAPGLTLDTTDASLPILQASDITASLSHGADSSQSSSEAAQTQPAPVRTVEFAKVLTELRERSASQVTPAL